MGLLNIRKVTEGCSLLFNMGLWGLIKSKIYDIAITVVLDSLEKMEGFYIKVKCFDKFMYKGMHNREI
jgi:hypothetical protein